MHNACDYASEVSKVLANEETNTGVLWATLKVAIWHAMCVLGVFDWDIVDERNGEVGYLVAEDVCNVVTEDGNRVGPPHGQLDEAHEPKRCVEGSEIV